MAYEVNDWGRLTDAEFSAALRDWKARHGLTLAGMGKALGVGRTTIWQWLQGNQRPLLDVVVGIATQHYDEHPEKLALLNPTWKYPATRKPRTRKADTAAA